MEERDSSNAQEGGEVEQCRWSREAITNLGYCGLFFPLVALSLSISLSSSSQSQWRPRGLATLAEISQQQTLVCVCCYKESEGESLCDLWILTCPKLTTVSREPVFRPSTRQKTSRLPQYL